MSSMLAMLLVGHKPCLFLRGTFLKQLPADVRAHLLRDDFSNSISLNLKEDEIYQSRFPLLQSTPSPMPRMSSTPSMPLSPLHPTALFSMLLHTPTAARTVVPSLLPSVIIIIHGDLRLRIVELPVTGRETSSPAGGCSYPTCWAFYYISINLSTRFPEFSEVSHQLWSFSISLSGSILLVKLVRCQVPHCRWFFTLMLMFLSNSSTVQKSQVRMAFPVGSSSSSNPGCRFFETFLPTFGCVKPESFQC